MFLHKALRQAQTNQSKSTRAEGKAALFPYTWEATAELQITSGRRWDVFCCHINAYMYTQEKDGSPHCVSTEEARCVTSMHHPQLLWPPQGESSETAFVLAAICSAVMAENLQPSSIYYCMQDYVMCVTGMNFKAEGFILILTFQLVLLRWYIQCTEPELLQWEDQNIRRVWLFLSIKESVCYQKCFMWWAGRNEEV